MINRIEKLREIATYLACEKEFQVLDNVEKTLSNKQFFLAVFGQFSAGKSRLLNNLLGEDILPVRVTETTAFLTFIKYGATTGAKMFYTDGQVEEMSIDKVQALFEGAQVEGVRSIEEIDYIEVYVPSPLLQSGLVLVDTPGVNTLIGRHQSLAISVIQASGRIVYVMGKALSDTDRRFIEMIKETEVDITFVRTKMDEIKQSEESYEEVIAKDHEVLAPYMGTSKLYHISNEPTCKEGYEVIGVLHQALEKEIVDDIEHEIEKNCQKQLEIIANRFKNLLVKEQQMLRQFLSDEVGNSEEKNLYYSNLIHELEERLEQKSKAYKKQITEMQREVEGKLVEVQEQAYQNAERKIFAVKSSSKVSEALAELSKEILEKTGEKFSMTYNDALDELVMEAKDEVTEMAQDLQLDQFMNIEEIMPNDFSHLEAEALSEEKEVQKILGQMNEVYSNIENIEAKIAEMDINEEEAEAIKQEFMNTSHELQMALADYAHYRPQYIESENQPMQVSQIMRKIGEVSDLALFFIPGNALAKGATALLKGEKVVKYASKVFGAADKVAKGIKKADTVKDALYVLQKVKNSKTYTTVRNKKRATDVIDKVEQSGVISRVLDKFTLAHWFEAVGKAFDQPTKMEVDKEYERLFFEEKRKLTEQYEMLQKEEIKRKEAYGYIKDEVERQKEIKAIEEKRAKELASCLEQRKIELRKELEEKAIKDLKADYLKTLAREMKNLRLYIMEYYNQKINERLEYLLMSYNQRLVWRIEITKDKQNKLLEQLQSGNKESLEQAIEVCAGYLEEIA